MKILRLKIRNLNSLKGENEIRFDAPPLADTGLFAIVGETGAGKTTLLDAITLALYGRIDREQESSGGGGRIMSWGTADCFAELEFSTEKGRYLAHWERNRARSKVDGKLQSAKHWVSAWNEAKQKWEFLAEKISETKQVIPEITGLDYGRFTRSVMLPQGAFARFLQADENERADLLEQITGTGIYRDISIAAFERHKLAVSDYQRISEQLDNLSLLSETQRQVLQEELKTQQDALAKLELQLKEISPGLKLYHRQLEIGLQKKQLVQLLEALEKARSAQQEERQLLSDHDQLSSVADALREHTSTQTQLAAKIQLSKTLKAQLGEQEKAIVQEHSKAKEADKALQDFLAKLPERENKINTAVSIEAERNALRKEIEKLTTEQQQAKTTESGYRLKLEKLAKQLRDLTEAQREIRIVLKNLLPDIDPEAKLETIPLLLADHLATLQTNISELNSKLRAHELAKKISLLTAEVTAAKKEIKTSEANHLATEKLFVSAEQNQQLQVELLRQLEQSLSLASLKSELAPGEPCPVCGSLDHPGLEHWTPPSTELLEKERSKAEQTDEALKKAREQKEQSTINLAAKRQKAYLLEVQLQEDKAKWTKENSAVSIKVASKWSVDELKQSIIATTEAQSATTELQQQIAQRISTDGAAKFLEQQQQLNLRLTETTAKIKTLEPAIVAAKKKLSEFDARLKELLSGMTVADARVSLKKREDHCRREADSKRASLDKTRGELRTTKSSLAELSKENTSLQNAITDLEHLILTQLNTEDKATIEAAKTKLLSTARAQQLRAEFTKIDQDLHSKRESYNALIEEEDAAAVIVADLPSLATLKTQEKDYGEQQKQLYQQSGAAQQRLTTDDNNRKAAGDLTTSLGTAEKERQRWAALDELIGSAKGDRFSRFAQSLTLDRLVAAANDQLVELLEGRYRIDRKPSVYRGKNPLHLGLEIIDTYQADNRRDTQTLSGGESFLVSLSLALGLSDLAGGNARIQSLFIDEGFGSLDEGLLDTVIDSLENLQAKGKTIGLISHVKELRERIHHKILIDKRGDGISEIVVV